MAIILMEYDDLCEDMWGKCFNCGATIYEPGPDWKYCPYCGERAKVIQGTTVADVPNLNELEYVEEEECGPWLEDYVDYGEMTPEQRRAVLNYDLRDELRD